MLPRRLRFILTACFLVALVCEVALPTPAGAVLPGYYIPGYVPGGATATPAPARAYHVGIQIGHYKIKEVPPALAPISRDLGTYGGGRNEVDVTYDVANLLAPMLRDKGVEVDLLPTTVPTGYTADAFVSLHADGAAAKDRRGYKVGTRYASAVAPQDALLSDLITEKYNAATGLPRDYRVNPNMRDYYAFSPDRPNYRVSNFTPVALIEMGYMTNAADRELMFGAPQRAAAGLADGIMAFLKSAYGSPRAARPYGYTVLDPTIDPAAPTFPPGGTPPDPHRQEGSFNLYLMGYNPTIKVYAEQDGAGGVIAELPKDSFEKSDLRIGSFYRIALPGGKPGWIYLNFVVVQM